MLISDEAIVLSIAIISDLMLLNVLNSIWISPKTFVPAPAYNWMIAFTLVLAFGAYPVATRLVSKT